MSKESTSSGPIIVAFALGALAGAAVALLFAPATGDEMRRKITEKAREGKERAGHAVRQGAEALKEQGEAIGDVITRGVEAFEQARKERL